MKKKILLIFTAVIILFGMIIFSAGGDTQTKKGDANLDGKIDASDARLVLCMAARLVQLPVSPLAFWSADANGDGKITSADARIILRVSSGLESLDDIYNESTAEHTTMIIVGELTGPQTTEPDTQAATDKEGSTGEAPLKENPSESPSGDDLYPMPEIPEYEKKSGTFAFISYGWGHGAGMSQRGCVYLAEKRDYDYKSILGYYYGGVGLARETPPEKITLNDTEVDTVEMLSRIVQQEIGGITYNREALKAQAVAVYTNIVEAGYRVKNLAYTGDLNSVRADVIQAVYDVYGEYLVYEGSVASAVFGAMSAGVTANPSYVWGGSYAYLSSVVSPFDRLSPGYISVKIYTVDEIRELIDTFNAKVRSGAVSFCDEINLTGSPSEWFKILEHNGAVSGSVGYVISMKVGDQLISSCAGQKLREHIFSYEIRSSCLIIEYYD